MDKDTRDKLIEAAAPLFAWKGFSGVSIRELSKAAGVNSALISYHFGGKEGLYAAVLESSLAYLLNTLERIHHSGLEPEQRIEHFARAVSGLHKQRPFLLRLLQGEFVNPTVCFENIVKPYFKKLVVFLPAAIQEGKSTGRFDQELHPFYAAMALASMVNFYFIVKPLADHVLPQDENRDEEYLRQVLKIYLSGVRRHDDA
jgi:AcrR family transcriptional regulator